MRIHIRLFAYLAPVHKTTPMRMIQPTILRMKMRNPSKLFTAAPIIKTATTRMNNAIPSHPIHIASLRVRNIETDQHKMARQNAAV